MGLVTGGIPRFRLAQQPDPTEKPDGHRKLHHALGRHLSKDSVIGWAKENIAPGDVVHTRGTMRQSEYTKDGQTVYDVTFAANDFDLLRKKASEG